MTTNHDGRRAVVSVRVRTIPTDPERDQLAIEEQRRACEAWCSEQGIQIADVLVNTGIARIPDSALVVSYDLSRLTRRPQDLAALLERDVQVATVTGRVFDYPAMLGPHLAVAMAEGDGAGHEAGLSQDAMRWRPSAINAEEPNCCEPPGGATTHPA
jgi:hypothetical protein